MGNMAFLHGNSVVNKPVIAVTKIATGTVTGVGGNDKTVTCADKDGNSFKPDAVFFTTISPHGGDKLHSGVAFTEANVTTMSTWGGAQNDDYIMSSFRVTQTSTGFKVRSSNLDYDFESIDANNRSLSYIAIKYTE